MAHTPPVAILCGGRGTRLQEHTRTIPKPLVEIGGLPIVWHVVRIYAHAGFRDFVLLTGYLGEQIEEFVATHDWPDGIRVTCVDTGQDTPTGGRIARAADRLRNGTFCATYADGVADLNLRRLLAFHADHGAEATMTVVKPELQREPLEGLAADGQLRAFRHDGFRDCMDTYKDAVLLNDLWSSGAPPWRVWR